MISSDTADLLYNFNGNDKDRLVAADILGKEDVEYLSDEGLYVGIFNGKGESLRKFSVPEGYRLLDTYDVDGDWKSDILFWKTEEEGTSIIAYNGLGRKLTVPSDMEIAVPTDAGRSGPDYFDSSVPSGILDTGGEDGGYNLVYYEGYLFTVNWKNNKLMKVPMPGQSGINSSVFDLAGAAGIHGIAIDKDSGTLWACDLDDSKIIEYDSGFSYLREKSLGSQPVSILISGDRLYVADRETDIIYILDKFTLDLIDQFALAFSSRNDASDYIDMCIFDGRLYVVGKNEIDGVLSMNTDGSDQELLNIEGQSFRGIAITADRAYLNTGSRILVVNHNQDILDRIDLTGLHDGFTDVVIRDNLIMTTSFSLTGIENNHSVLFFPESHEENIRIYMANDHGFMSSFSPGSDQSEDMRHYGIFNSYGIALDRQDRKIYWTDYSRGAIFQSDFLGNGKIQLIDEDLVMPADIAVDPEKQRLYWTDFGNKTVKTSRSDGSGVQILLDESVVDAPIGLALDAGDDKLYITDESEGTILRISTDGSDREILVSGQESPHSLALDEANLFLFWSNWVPEGRGSIKRLEIATGKVETIVSGLTYPMGLAFVLDLNRLYYFSNNEIRSCDPDGRYNASHFSYDHSTFMDIYQ
ncbi:MAG: hypothetical protein JXR86_13415 [Spirochaetales bacterium]|nr:hypothetical protein [Spirochaetales bacterium]